MISGENQEEIDVELEDDDLDSEDEDDKTDWKAEAAKYKGLAKRYQTKLSKQKEAKTEPEKTKTETKKEEKTLDYGQKAYLVANGIKGAEELALVNEYLATGKELDDIIESKHFQNDLKDLREERATKEATPSNSKRSSNSGKDSVEYWLNKGELPPVDQIELRRKVVNAKMKSSSESSPFAKQAVV